MELARLRNRSLHRDPFPVETYPMGPRPLSLELNPSATISISDPDASPSFLVEAPIKGASFSSVRVCADNLPGAHAFLRSILIDGNKNAQISEQDAVELRQIGLFAPADALPQAVEFTAHNHLVANFWHDQLNERVTQLAGQRTKLSYSFVSLYIEGGDLFWHTDRPPCEYTITLLLDYAPLDADSRSPWALKVKGRDGTTHSLHLRVGEALILKGRELVHGREVLPDAHRSASLLFHFVNEDFAGELE